jgi:pimeloyl-ACP methyl ester carboxylesterase
MVRIHADAQRKHCDATTIFIFYMSSEHHVIIVPGLGNGVGKHEWATKNWEHYGLIPHVFDAQWTISEPDLQSKLANAIKLVDELYSPTTLVSLVGNSAGSSFVLNVFHRRKEKIHKVVINCGRVRKGDWPWFTFRQATASSPSFKESVIESEKALQTLSSKERKKILTLRPIFDEVVPPATVPVEGATNEVIPSIGHVLSIALNMTMLSGRIRRFLTAPLV